MERTTYDVRITFYSRLIRFLMINLMQELTGGNHTGSADVTPKICYTAGLNISQFTVHFYHSFVKCQNCDINIASWEKGRGERSVHSYGP